MKGNSEYQREIIMSVINDLTKAVKILNDIDHNFGFCEGIELEYDVVSYCTRLLASTRDNLYSGEEE